MQFRPFRPMEPLRPFGPFQVPEAVDIVLLGIGFKDFIIRSEPCTLDPLKIRTSFMI